MPRTFEQARQHMVAEHIKEARASKDNDILAMLLELDIEQIEEVQRRHREKYPNERRFAANCQCAIGIKRGQQQTREFVALIEEVKNAPSGATNTEQGNM